MWKVNSLNIEKRKECKNCETNFPINCFPKKSKDRYEVNCKSCHSLKKRNDRKKKAVSKWCLSNISTQINWVEDELCNFTNSLFSVLKSQEYIENTELINNDNHLLVRKNSIEIMLE